MIAFKKLKPKKLNDVAWEAIIEAWENGLSDREASFRASKISGQDITADDLRKWCKDDPELGELRANLQSDLLSEAKLTVADALRSKDTRTARWYFAIMWKENVDVSITGNSTNPTRFQHPVAGTYKKERVEAGKKYFSVASGGGTGRTLHPDNMAAGPASYGMTDTMGRMHSDAQFAGSSSVPAHVEMMGLIGAGNNPMVGMTVSTAVSIEEAAKAGKF